jgi:hypothetical protein
MTTNADLLPCPHCKGLAHFQPALSPDGIAGHLIECSASNCRAASVLMADTEPIDLCLAALAKRWNRREGKDIEVAPPPAFPVRPVPQFPVALPKVWSGHEVQDWINANWTVM